MSFSHSVVELVTESDNLLLSKASWWERVCLADVCAIQNGFPFSSSGFNKTTGVPVIRIRDVTLGASETYFDGDIPNGYWVETDDLVVGMDGDFNSRLWPSERALLNQRVCKLEPDQRFLDKHFLNYGLPAYLQLINQHTHSITVKHLSSRTISQIPFPLPPIAEQRRIVTKLDSLFARTRRACEELERVPQLVGHYRQEILRKAFEGELTVNWRVTNAHVEMSDDVSRIDNRVGELPFLPSGWAWSSLDRVAQVSGGLTKNAKRRQIGNHVPYLRVANVYANELRLDDVQEIGCTEAELHKTRLEKDDLLIVEGNGSLEHIGRVALWNGSIDPCSHQNHLIRVRAPSAEQSKYLLYWLLSPLGRQFIERVASSSSGLYTLSISKVSGLPVPVCSLQEMAAVVKQIEKSWFWLDGFIGDCGNAIRLLDQLDSSILAKAFRGELVPQNPNDEPASVLLERITAERNRKAGVPSTRPKVLKDQSEQMRHDFAQG